MKGAEARSYGKEPLMRMRNILDENSASSVLAPLYGLWSVVAAHGYAFNQIVPAPALQHFRRARLPRAHSSTHQSGQHCLPLGHGAGSNPLTIITQDQTPTGRLNESSRPFSSPSACGPACKAQPTPASLVTLVRVASRNTCSSEAINSICFDQPEMSFTPGVLVFTRVITADRIGFQTGSSAVSTEVGQILDAGIYFNPGDSLTSFATPQALSTNPKSCDRASI